MSHHVQRDTRTPEQKAAFREESKHWSRVIMEHEKEFQTHEQKRLDFMWEAINAIPAGRLRDAAMQPDYSAPPDVMSSVEPASKLLFVTFGS